MFINYALLAICAIFGIIDIVTIVKGNGKIRPFRTIAYIVVFVLVLVATFMGLTYDQLLAIIEGRA